METYHQPVEWEVEVPLLTDRHMLGYMLIATLGAAAGVTLLVAFPLAVQGEWDSIVNLVKLFAVAGSGLFALSLLIMAIVFRNGLRMYVRLDEEGVLIRQVDRTARFTNRAAVWAGLVLGRPGAAGAGALAISQEEQTLSWKGAFDARFEPATRSIAFRNGWRTLMRVYCLPETYEAASAFVRAMMTEHGTVARMPVAPPLHSYFLRTLLVSVCTVPLFALVEEHNISLFAPFLLLCFALAMVWFVRPLALVVLGALLWQATEVALSLFEVRESMFGGPAYQRYEILSGDDWALLATAGLAAGVLAWQAVQIWRGRVVPALTRDWEDSGDI